MLLAWKSTKRGWLIPAEQILGHGRVAKGMAPVLEAVGDPELAWTFLTEPWPFEEEVVVSTTHGLESSLTDGSQDRVDECRLDAQASGL
jgi:hypothetical protein